MSHWGLAVESHFSAHCIFVCYGHIYQCFNGHEWEVNQTVTRYQAHALPLDNSRESKTKTRRPDETSSFLLFLFPPNRLIITQRPSVIGKGQDSDPLRTILSQRKEETKNEKMGKSSSSLLAVYSPATVPASIQNHTCHWITAVDASDRGLDSQGSVSSPTSNPTHHSFHSPKGSPKSPYRSPIHLNGVN